MSLIPSAPDPRHGQPGSAVVPPPIVNAPPSGLALLKALRRRWQLAAIVAPLAGIIVAAATWFLAPTPKYVVRSTLELNPTPPNAIVRPPIGSDISLDNFRQLQMALIKSQRILIAALRDPMLSQLPTLRDVDSPLDWLDQSISFAAPGNGQVLQVFLEGPYPDDLRPLLDGVIKTYLSEFINYEQEIRNARLVSLKRYKDQFQEELSQAKAARSQFFERGGAKVNVVDLQIAFLQTDLQRRQSELSKLETEVAELEAQQKQLSSRDPKRVSLYHEVFREFFAKDAEIQSLDGQLREANETLTDAKLKGFKEPVLTKLKDKIDGIEKQILTRKQQLRPQAEEFWKQRSASELAKHGLLIADSLEIKRSLVQKYQADLDRARAMLENLSRNQNKLDDLALDNQALVDISKQVEMEYNRVKLGANNLPRVRELEEARLMPSDPQARRIKLSAMSGGLAFFLVLAGLALWEFHARRVESVDQIVYGLGLPLVGTVPAMPRQRLLGLAGGLKDEDLQSWRFAIQEAVATARTMLLNVARSTDLRMVMITSAVPGEGKTTLSTQLAVSLALAGHRTLLLDFDMRNPSAHTLLGLNHAPGWAEILRGEINVAKAVQQTRVENLSFIPAGECDPLALKALVQDELSQVLNWLRAEYEFIIVDSCPVLPVADALLLGRHMDGVIFSVLNDVSQIPKIYIATQRVAQLGIRTLGAVVNGIREEKYGYGHYGYSYHHAGQPKPAPEPKHDPLPPGESKPTPGES